LKSEETNLILQKRFQSLRLQNSYISFCGQTNAVQEDYLF